MTKSLIRFSIFAVVCSLFFISSCKKDEELDRVKFIGTYGAVETCNSGNDSYDIVITASSTGDDKIVISNLYAFPGTLVASVSGNNITIASQAVQNITYSGSGSLNGNTLTISFSVTDGSNADNCTSICTKK
ncbi:MAG: hypothetical protein KDC24_09710 [Saprospiraceae bacterium]|nr:hypothetical protein [Saprospiraceae bacterium]